MTWVFSSLYTDFIEPYLKKDPKQNSTDNVLDLLPNRQEFVQFLSHRLDQKKSEELAIVTIAVDRFPQVNHALGHYISERLLHHVGERLTKELPRAEIVAQLTNNIFIVLLPNITPQDYIQELEKIVHLFESSFSVYTVNIDLDGLVGVSFYPQDGTEPNSLIQKSDVALYQAKFKPERYAIYDREKDPHHFNKISLMTELRDGLAQNEFEIFYQPKIALNTSRIVQVESLIRWRHPIRGFMQPDAFIPLAEETGHIKKLSIWLLEQTFIQQQAWQKENLNIGVSINLSVKDLLNKELIPFSKGLIEKYQIDPATITLEITESSFMHDPEKATEAIQQLTQIGFHFSIDDFGIEYSALSYLKRLTVHELKIDKSFIEEITKQERVAKLVEAIIKLGHSLNVKIVAEGIEDLETYEKLKSLNCDLGQGFLFCEAISAQEFLRWLKTSPWGI